MTWLTLFWWRYPARGREAASRAPERGTHHDHTSCRLDGRIEGRRRERPGVRAGRLIVTGSSSTCAQCHDEHERQESWPAAPSDPRGDAARTDQAHSARCARASRGWSRERGRRWPEVGALTLPGGDYFWMRFERGVVVNYLKVRRSSSPHGFSRSRAGAVPRQTRRPTTKSIIVAGRNDAHTSGRIALAGNRLEFVPPQNADGREVFCSTKPAHASEMKMTRPGCGLTKLAFILALGSSSVVSAQPKPVRKINHTASLLFMDEERRRRSAGLKTADPAR